MDNSLNVYYQQANGANSLEKCTCHLDFKGQWGMLANFFLKPSRKTKSIPFNFLTLSETDNVRPAMCAVSALNGTR